MRLYNTYSRALDELPEPPGPVRMYVCGPTVYARAHIGQRPSVHPRDVAALVASVAGYDVTLVHNITDINDKIYEAAPGRARSWPSRPPSGTSRTPTAFGLGRPDHVPKASEIDPRDRRVRRAR